MGFFEKNGTCGCLSDRGDETETREEAYGDPIPQNVNFLDQKSKVKVMTPMRILKINV